jgi:hypothetical protein
VNNLVKSKIISIGAVVFLVLLPVVWGADIEGNWIAKVPWFDTVFYFSVDGTKLTGSVTDHQGKAEIREGKINGDEISFFVVRNSAGKDIKLVYFGKAAENEIVLSWTSHGVSTSPQKLIAKREFLRNNDYIHRAISAPVKPLIR